MKRLALLLTSTIIILLLLSSCRKQETLPDNSSNAGIQNTVTTPSDSPDIQPSAETQTPFAQITAPPSQNQPTIPISPGTNQSGSPDLSLLSDEAFWGRIDGSTATRPMSFVLFEHFMGDGKNPNMIIDHSTTHSAYQNLLNENADLIFVTEPSTEAQKLFDDAGVGIDVIPIVKDAFVLLINAKNPVSSLTQQQLRDIYSGKITNWKYVGGNDQEIIPFQRGETSGSQTLFRSLLMHDTEPMLAPSAYYYGDMGGIIDAVADYINGEASIGFSVFYYAYAMYGNDNIRFLKVDGVLPTEKTIIAGSYPLESNYYAVLRKDTPTNHPARELVSWILSDDGQALMRKTGYVPLRELPASYNPDKIEPRSYGELDFDMFYGYAIGAEPVDSIMAYDIYSVPRRLDSGVYYSHPVTFSTKVNTLLNTFIKDTMKRSDFNTRMDESLHKYGAPFQLHTLSWNHYITCIFYFSDRIHKYLYTDIPDTFEVYASICIDERAGEKIDPSIIIDSLLDLEYMEGAKTVYERIDYSWLWFTSDWPVNYHIPSDKHTVMDVWIYSEQGLIVDIMDQGNFYRYGFCTNDSGGYAGE